MKRLLAILILSAACVAAAQTAVDFEVRLDLSLSEGQPTMPHDADLVHFHGLMIAPVAEVRVSHHVGSNFFIIGQVDVEVRAPLVIGLRAEVVYDLPAIDLFALIRTTHQGGFGGPVLEVGVRGGFSWGD